MPWNAHNCTTLYQNPLARITVSGLRRHRWLTEAGAAPLPPRRSTGSFVITEDDLAGAISLHSAAKSPSPVPAAAAADDDYTVPTEEHGEQLRKRRQVQRAAPAAPCIKQQQCRS